MGRTSNPPLSPTPCACLLWGSRAPSPLLILLALQPGCLERRTSRANQRGSTRGRGTTARGPLDLPWRAASAFQGCQRPLTVLGHVGNKRGGVQALTERVQVEPDRLRMRGRARPVPVQWGRACRNGTLHNSHPGSLQCPSVLPPPLPYRRRSQVAESGTAAGTPAQPQGCAFHPAPDQSAKAREQLSLLAGTGGSSPGGRRAFECLCYRGTAFQEGCGRHLHDQTGLHGQGNQRRFKTGTAHWEGWQGRARNPLASFPVDVSGQEHVACQSHATEA